MQKWRRRRKLALNEDFAVSRRSRGEKKCGFLKGCVCDETFTIEEVLLGTIYTARLLGFKKPPVEKTLRAFQAVVQTPRARSQLTYPVQ